MLSNNAMGMSYDPPSDHPRVTKGVRQSLIDQVKDNIKAVLVAHSKAALEHDFETARELEDRFYGLVKYRRELEEKE